MMMKPLTPELRKEIEESGVPLIQMSMEELKSCITGVSKKNPFLNKKQNG
jgi:DNA-directed RNA polymerase specialized sigma54-like protein